jgi:lipoprotein
MKKNVLKVMQAFLLIFLFALVLVSCQKDSDSDSSPVIHEEMLSENSADSSSQSLFSEMATIVPFKVDEGEVFAFSATSRAALNNSNEYDVVPKFGRTKSTVHVFKASVNKADSEQVYLKLYNKASGAIQYFPMVQASSVNYQLNLRINQNGWYDYRYVIGDKAGRILKNVSNSPARTLCSTYNVFDKDGVSHITWPFGADGSSWTKRTVNGQTWKGGADEEPLTGPGYGHNEGTHTGITERFSEDWNRGSKSYDDFNLEIRSPLDGVIERVDSYYVQNHGRSHFVSVVQEDENGNKFRFYVAHLNTTIPRSYVGRYVRAGVDKLGTLGKSGASSPHAHCNLRFGVGYQKPSIQFRFDAIK